MKYIEISIIIIVIIILLIYVYPFIKKNLCTEKFNNDDLPQPEFYSSQGERMSLAEDMISDMSLNNNICSPACCSHQWPLPFKIPIDKSTCNSNDEYTKSNYFCSNSSQDSGCVCMKKGQGDFIGSRGGNS